MNKKKVTLDVFEESVLPTLEQKHKKDAAKIQAEIDEKYFIYELSEDGKEMKVKFTVQAQKSLDGDGNEVSEEDRIAGIVAKALEAERKKNPGNRNPLGATPGDRSIDLIPKMVIPVNVKRYGSVRNFKRENVGDFDRTERAYRFGMWALACLGNENSKRFCDEQGIEVKLHQGNIDSVGGFLVPDEFSTDMIDLRLEYGTFRRNARIRPMNGDTLTVPRRTGGLTAYFVAEASAGTESTKSWDQVRLVAKDLMVISRMTNQLNDDAVINIGDDLAGEIGYAFALKEDQCGFLGDGSATYGGIVGVSTQLANLNGVDDGGGLILASGNAYSEIVIGDFNKVVARTPSYARKGAKWYASPTFNDSTMQRVAYAAGGNNAANIAAGSQPSFLGYPIELAEVLPTSEANSQICCLFGNLALAASFGDRQQDRIDFSKEASVGGQSLWERNEIGIRGTQRFDIVVHDVGNATTAGPVVGLITAAS